MQVMQSTRLVKPLQVIACILFAMPFLVIPLSMASIFGSIDDDPRDPTDRFSVFGYLPFVMLGGFVG